MKYAESPCANLPGNPAPMSVRVASEEQWSVQVHHRFRTDMLHPPLPISAEPVKAQTVLCLVDLVEKSRSQFRPLRGINLTFEYRILYTLAQIETSAGPATKTATAAGILRVSIIGNEHQHRSDRKSTRLNYSH